MEKEKSSFTLETQQWIIFSCLGAVTLFNGLAYAIQGPFYPIEAQNKGVSIAIIGFVYGIHELANFFVSPVIGSLMRRVGPAVGLYLGIIVTGVGTAGLGVLGFLENTTWFILLSIVCRVVQAIGASFRAIAVISIATFSFQNAVGTAFAIIESIFGIGMSVGVLVAGGLMEITGFKETFIISGSLLLLTLPVSIVVLQKYDFSTTTTTSTVAKEENGTSNGFSSKGDAVNEKCSFDTEGAIVPHRQIGLLDLLRVPTILLALLGLVSPAISLGFMGVLEPHLKQFNLSPILIGLMFLYPPLAYVIGSPCLGYLYDKIQPQNLYYVQYVGPISLFVSFSFIGPAPFIPADPSVLMISLGLICLGVAMSSAFVACFLLAVNEGKNIAAKDDEMRVHELISGIWRASISLGMFLGSSVVGVLYEMIGFSNATLLIIGLQVLHFILILSCKCFYKVGPSKSVGQSIST